MMHGAYPVYGYPEYLGIEEVELKSIEEIEAQRSSERHKRQTMRDKRSLMQTLRKKFGFTGNNTTSMNQKLF